MDITLTHIMFVFFISQSGPRTDAKALKDKTLIVFSIFSGQESNLMSDFLYQTDLRCLRHRIYSTE